MLLCIEVYPPNILVNDDIGLKSDFVGGIQPEVVHFASLNQIGSTSSSNNSNNNNTNAKNDGIVWSVGRKSGHYHLDSDKSVSREHCNIKIVTTTGMGSSSTSTSSSSNSGGMISALPAPPNDEKIQLECQESNDQLCVLVENVGKLGTYIIIEPPDDDADDTEKNTDNADAATKKQDSTKKEDDSDTEDEMEEMNHSNNNNNSSSSLRGGETIITSQQNFLGQSIPSTTGVSFSPITIRLLQARKVKNIVQRSSIQAVSGMNEQAILHPLTSIRYGVNGDGTSGTKYNNHNKTKILPKSVAGRVIIQVGKLGSTIVITRMPKIAFIGSGTLAKSELTSYKQKLCTVGAIQTEEINFVSRMPMYRPPASLPNNNRGENNVPLFSSNFLQKYYNAPSHFNNIYDPYCYIVVSSQYTASMKQLLAWTCRIPIVSPTFIQALLNHKITSLPSPEQYQPKSDNNTFWYYKTIQPNPSLWNGLTMLVISPETKSKGNSTTTTTKQQQETENHDLEQLIRSAGANVVKVFENGNHDGQDDATTTSSSDDSIIISTVQTFVQEHPETICFIVQSQPNDYNRYEKLIQKNFSSSIISFVTTKQIAKCITTQTMLLPERMMVNTKKSKVPVKEAENVQSSLDTIMDPPASSAYIGDDHISSASSCDPNLLLSIKTEDNFVPNTTEVDSIITTQTNTGTSTHRKGAVVVVPKRTIAKVTPSGGWVTAMPKNKKHRSTFIRSNEEIRDAYGFDIVRDVAVTEHVKGLIVPPTTATNHNRNNGYDDDDYDDDDDDDDDDDEAKANENDTLHKKHVPDFKTFRKNPIATVPSSRTNLRFRSVLPNEADNRRDAEEQQQSLLEQQRRADQLFRGQVK